jgi:mono/diheme cytochrome c family protein
MRLFLMRLLAMTPLCFAAVAAGAVNPVTFNKDVLPIVQEHCQECHRPNQIGPMSLLTYQEARPWAKAIKNAVLTKKMPPWFADPNYGHFLEAGARTLSQKQIETIAAWVDNGAPEGDPKDKPEPHKFSAEGWSIKPDFVFAMPRPYEIPASGTIEYTEVVIPTGFTKDTWVSAAEILPSNRGYVHHMQAFIRPPGSTWLKEAKPGEFYVPVAYKRDANGFATGLLGGTQNPQSEEEDSTSRYTQLAAYVPGLQPQNFSLSDSALLIPAGSDLVLEIHYTTNGTPGSDLTRIGMTEAKHPTKYRYLTLVDSANKFTIPPGDSNYEIRAEGTFALDTQLVWLQPHMHLRGKDMEIRLIYPDGRAETIIKVPHYSFLWQIGYDEEKPLPIPKGTTMQVIAHMDNSPNNPYNPNPNVAVPHGDQSWEEMMEGWFAVIVDKDIDARKVLIDRHGTAGPQ